MAFIAIDDTYSPATIEATRYVTTHRRTYVAVQFGDEEAEAARAAVSAIHDGVRERLGVRPIRLHFNEIYNRRDVWKRAPGGYNLEIFRMFADLYARHRWPVHVQTVDDRTLQDHRLVILGRYDGINVSEREGQALMFLLRKLVDALPPPPEIVTIRVDQGKGKPGSVFAPRTFAAWGSAYDGRYEASTKEPLLQLADFLAFSINRNTHLQMKSERTDLDKQFMAMVGGMRIDCPDLIRAMIDIDATPTDFDELHRQDRIAKGLEPAAPGEGSRFYRSDR